ALCIGTTIHHFPALSALAPVLQLAACSTLRSFSIAVEVSNGGSGTGRERCCETYSNLRMEVRARQEDLNSGRQKPRVAHPHPTASVQLHRALPPCHYHCLCCAYH